MCVCVLHHCFAALSTLRHFSLPTTNQLWHEHSDNSWTWDCCSISKAFSRNIINIEQKTKDQVRHCWKRLLQLCTYTVYIMEIPKKISATTLLPSVYVMPLSHLTKCSNFNYKKMCHDPKSRFSKWFHLLDHWKILWKVKTENGENAVGQNDNQRVKLDMLKIHTFNSRTASTQILVMQRT